MSGFVMARTFQREVGRESISQDGFGRGLPGRTDDVGMWMLKSDDNISTIRWARLITSSNEKWSESWTRRISPILYSWSKCYNKYQNTRTRLADVVSIFRVMIFLSRPSHKWEYSLLLILIELPSAEFSTRKFNMHRRRMLKYHILTKCHILAVEIKFDYLILLLSNRQLP